MISVNAFKNSKSWYFIGILFFIGYIIFAPNSNNYNILVLTSSFLVVLIALYCLFFLFYKPFFLNGIVNIFFIFFIGLAPALQFKKGVHFMGAEGVLTPNDFIYGNLIFIGILVGYNFLYYHFYKLFHKNIDLIQISSFSKFQNLVSNKDIVLLSVLFTFITFIYFSFDLKVIFNRWSLNQSFFNSNTSFFSIINILRSAPLILFLYYKLDGKRNIYLEIFLLILVVICNFPIGIARYRVAVIYLPIFIIYFKQMFKNYNFHLLFSLGMLFIFPILHFFRNKKITISFLNFEMFTQLHFDSYQNTMNIILNDINTSGSQLLGVVFFFIPRSVWETKPIGSADVLANQLNYNGFSNVAISYFGEGYINFGFVGILLFLIFLAILNSYLDGVFWLRKRVKSYFFIIYLIIIPMEFYILRGSLMSTFSNLVGYIFVTIFLYIVLNKRKIN